MTRASQIKHFAVRPFACIRCHDRYEFNTDDNGTLIMFCSCSGWRKSVLTKPLPVHKRKQKRSSSPRNHLAR